MNEKIRLTVAITAYFNSNPNKFRNMILSLFSKQTNKIWTITKDNMLNPKKENEILFENITTLSNLTNDEIEYNILKLNEKIELLIIFDNNPEFRYKIDNLIKIVELFKPYIKEFCEIRYIIPVANVRISCARNIVFKEAKGEYIAFCDDDDIRINANNLLKILNDNYGKDYISHYMICGLYDIQTLDKIPFVSNLASYCGLLRKEFINKHKIYFTPFLAAEDVVWRSNMDYIINYVEGTICQTELCGYVYMDASQTSLNNILFNSRYLNTIDFNSTSIFNKSNLDYYRIIDLILSHQLIFGFKLTDYRIFGITTSATYWRGYNIIKYWLQKNVEKLDKQSYDYKMIKLSSKLIPDTSENLFNLLTDEDQILCVENIPKYFTLPDLLTISKQLDKNIPYIICDQLWNTNLNVNTYKHKFNLNEFVFRFMCLQYLRRGNYKNIIGDKAEIIQKMFELYLKEDEQTGIHDFYMYAHDLISRRFSVSDVFNLYNDKTINKETIEEYVENKSIYKYAYEKYKIDHDIKTTSIDKYDTHYKGIINVFIFYILGCDNMLNQIPDINIKHNFNNYTGYDYEIYSI